jgi:hypothetical protein
VAADAEEAEQRVVEDEHGDEHEQAGEVERPRAAPLGQRQPGERDGGSASVSAQSSDMKAIAKPVDAASMK